MRVEGAHHTIADREFSHIGSARMCLKDFTCSRVPLRDMEIELVNKRLGVDLSVE